MPSAPIANLKPVLAGPAPCKICGSASPLYGVVDFNHSCKTPHGKRFPLLGVPIYYRRCPACGFMFSDCFDDWTEHEFKQHIYDDLYVAVDPDYIETRPKATARLVEQLFRKDKSRLRLLDYGGGNGVCCQELRVSGFLSADTYDPFTPAYASRPEGTFDVVLCVETLEHLPRPMAEIESIIEYVSDSGVVLFTTLVQPTDLEKEGMNWWYIGPRNGHISLFSQKSLVSAWQRFGFKVVSFNDNLHLAFRKIPDFARHLVNEHVALG